MGSFSIWHLLVLLVFLGGGVGLLGVVIWWVTRSARGAATPAAALPSVAERLRQLDALKAEGLISEAEHACQRATIVQGV